MNSLRDQIFPSPPPRDGFVVRTEFVGSWEAQFAGVGRLTAFVTDYLLRFSAALDDVGLSVVYLQRHHLELGLKLLLERAGATQEAIDAGHDLGKLLAACEEEIGSGKHADALGEFVNRHGELLRLMDEVDPQSFVFRYPVDRSRQRVSRPPLVDLRELEVASSSFHRAVDSLVDLFARDEPLSVAPEERAVAEAELEAAIKAIKLSRATIDAMDSAVRNLHDQIRVLPDKGPDARAAEAIAGREEQFAVADALITPLARALELISGSQVQIHEIEPDPLPEPPGGPVEHPIQIKQRLDEYIPWVAKLAGGSTRKLGQALRAVFERSEHWPGLASRQLHDDVGRVLARIHPALVEQATTEVSTRADPNAG
jgi:hypothetical protein